MMSVTGAAWLDDEVDGQMFPEHHRSSRFRAEQLDSASECQALPSGLAASSPPRSRVNAPVFVSGPAAESQASSCTDELLIQAKFSDYRHNRAYDCLRILALGAEHPDEH